MKKLIMLAFLLVPMMGHGITPQSPANTIQGCAGAPCAPGPLTSLPSGIAISSITQLPPISGFGVLCNPGSSATIPIACKEIYVPAIDAKLQEFFSQVTAVSGQSTITFGGGSWSSADVGKYIVVGGIGPQALVSPTVVSGGTGYAVGDTIVLSGGTVSSGYTASTVIVQTVSAGAVTEAAVLTQGGYSTVPTGTISQASTSGSGTGATFAATWAAQPLPATITSYAAGSGTSIIGISTPVVTSQTSATQWAAWGHDDSTNLNIALGACSSAGITHVILTSQYYLQTATLNLPQTCKVDVDGGGSTIIAGAAVTDQMLAATATGFYATVGSIVHDFTLEGMGIAINGIHHQEFGWKYSDLSVQDQISKNIFCDSHYCENTYFETIHLYNSTLLVPGYTTYNIYATYTDNHFTDIISSGAAVNSFYDGGSGNYYTNVHGYNNSTGAIWLLAGSGGFLQTPYADSVGASQIGISVTGNGYNIMNPQITAFTSSGQIGIQLGQSTAQNIVMGGTCRNSVTTANCVVQTGNTSSTPQYNIVLGVANSQYSAIGRYASSICLGLQQSCNGAEAVSIGQFGEANFNDVSIGHSDNATGLSTFAYGVDASDQGRTGGRFFANGQIAAVGDTQLGDVLLFGKTTSTSAFRLTSDGTGTASSTNCDNIPNNGLWGLEIDATAVDTGSITANYGRWHWGATAGANAPIIVRGSSASTTVVGGTTSAQAVTVAGTATTGAMVLSADTTNGCVNLTWTAPNSDTWDVRAHVHTLE